MIKSSIFTESAFSSCHKDQPVGGYPWPQYGTGAVKADRNCTNLWQAKRKHPSRVIKQKSIVSSSRIPTSARFCRVEEYSMNEYLCIVPVFFPRATVLSNVGGRKHSARDQAFTSHHNSLWAYKCLLEHSFLTNFSNAIKHLAPEGKKVAGITIPTSELKGS